ncbi:similar to Saccharomyces cerevisiae YLR316C TAD3 Subunit of tRNA-specific adenosine-34 deaminase [Maudiozyma saulgeensis]|uniref:Similar to Saccharomyces cerevisiae YLR316C TAD3 Subunit of tRNA-specific adenosine-34 deaminase n=1 Tax=Maudiozyma saulgeensis TaxID=1789683 RepID=A0A1X7R9C1_9SACH|nr:similar to Saccharomyces cerevisiae YLR316C TAD3 Subunit of tRNA-specific adenosine-34 deaminase [Kazachstania saulgeensis]
MVKKALNPLKIDFKKGIIENKLQQIRNSRTTTTPDLIKVWTIEVNPKDSKYVLDLIRTKTQKQDPISMLHIKRIRKITNSDTSVSLVVVIGSVELFEDKNSVQSMLHSFRKDLKYSNLSSSHEIPKEGPQTKELMLQWSDEYWPLVWRGNPNDQILNDYTFNMPFIEDILLKIHRLSQEQYENGNIYPIVTAFVDPNDSTNCIYACDTRAQQESSPLDHSIRIGINAVSKRLKERKKVIDNAHTEGYLCLDFDVYTTHEPCSMCSMALIHSRIKRCIFIQPMTMTGSLKHKSGDGYCMHQHKLLNSSYEAFQWVGDKLDPPEISQSTCC